MKRGVGIVFALALALAAACGPAERPSGPPDPSDPFSYRVDPELAPLFEGAAGRLLEASGVQLTPDGDTPIVAVDSLPSDEGEDNCGLTLVEFYPDPFQVVSVTIEILWPQPNNCGGEGTVLHELIHSLRRHRAMKEQNHGHSADGVFSKQGGNRLLTESSLTALCEAVECSTFNPER